MPEVAGVADMTGDGLPAGVEVRIAARTPATAISPSRLTREGFRNLRIAATPPDAISLSYPEVRLVPEGDRSVLMPMEVIGSAGGSCAPIQRSGPGR